MYPGFRKPWMRRLNAKLIARAVHRALGPRERPPRRRRVVITTVPITADLPGLLDVDRWIYYCVDDFSVWPGLDGSILDIMDLQLATKVDAVLAVSQTLQARLKGWGCDSTLLTHGIDLEHWGWQKAEGPRDQGTEGPRGEAGERAADSPWSSGRPSVPVGEGWGEGGGTTGEARVCERPSPSPGLAARGMSATLDQRGRSQASAAADASAPRSPGSSVPWSRPPWWPRDGRPVLLFWGVVDQRLDIDWCRALATCGRLVLLGPQQSPHPQLGDMEGIVMPGPVAYDDLPALARAAAVLVMPYADLPVTRALQPLKFKEYLATGRPVVTRKLPATQEWSDAADVVDTIDALVAVTKQRILQGTPASQMKARARLADESWAAKARVLEAAIVGGLSR
jgi:glycosyltransferase involved in cell wall biosynthesis